MFVFSRKLLLLLVVIALVFRGERHSVKGLTCWKCKNPDTESHFTDLCDADHGGEEVECGDGTTDACALKQLRGKDEYRKYCAKAEEFGDKYGCGYEGNRDPILVCHCKTDLCNKDKNFGIGTATDRPGGTPAGGGNDAKGDSVGTKGTFSTCVLCWLSVVMVSMVLCI
ncbi:unnamed protein product [Orchesella dallaii]|uniref:Protein sleepless n=1 Tax=Orchesella dallaii TaxID=48710 RepID=A0ABP1R9N0_9HEXA